MTNVDPELEAHQVLPEPSSRPRFTPPDPSTLHGLDVVSGEVRADARTRCRIIRHMTSEMFALICERSQIGRDSRRYVTHTRYIAMYVCHVTLGLPMGHVAIGFGFDRSTVSYACQSVEQRRDDPGYEEFVHAVERVAISIFGPVGGVHGRG